MSADTEHESTGTAVMIEDKIRHELIFELMVLYERSDECGIKPSMMRILLGRSKGAIVSRRETLSMKILGGNNGMKVIDGIIRLL